MNTRWMAIWLGCLALGVVTGLVSDGGALRLLSGLFATIFIIGLVYYTLTLGFALFKRGALSVSDSMDTALGALRR